MYVRDGNIIYPKDLSLALEGLLNDDKASILTRWNSFSIIFLENAEQRFDITYSHVFLSTGEHMLITGVLPFNLIT